MKRTFLFIAVILGLGLCAFARDEKKMDAGLGPEWNMNTHENFAGGIVLGFNYHLPHSLAAGLNVTASTNFSGSAVIEPAALFRWYFIESFRGKGHTGFFAQADVGAFLFIDEGETTPYFLGGLRAGYRFPVSQSFFIEPYGRFGYPFAFGIGVSAGLNF